jgi:uncharacterized protein YdeI (YjbR/CyaY-like superfamily)
MTLGTRDPRVDAYIEKSAEFARPILQHLRSVVHEACPEVEEDMKWSMPHFSYKGMFAGMAAFKKHCTFGFWKHDLIVGESPKAKEAMGSFGCIASLADLPSKKELAGYVKTAKKLNDDGVKAVRKKTVKKPLGMPAEFTAALKKNKKARAAFESFPPSAQREYTDWIAEAKTEATRKKRLETAIEWLAEGKRRHWKYQDC